MVIEIANEYEDKPIKGVKKIEDMLTSKIQEVGQPVEGEMYLAKDGVGDFILFYANDVLSDKVIVSIHAMTILLEVAENASIFIEVLGKYDTGIKTLAY